MAFFESQFPPSYLITGFEWTPEFHTTTLVLGAGYEQRNKDWATARGQGKANIRTDETGKTNILNFFYNVSGGADGFRAKIWADYQGTDQLIGVVDGTTTVFQLIKIYTTGSRSYTRNIYKPVSGTVTLKSGTLGGGPGGASPWNNFTVDTTTGLLTLTAQPTTGWGLWATYEFDTPVKMTDTVQVSLFSPNPTATGFLYDIVFDFLEIRETT